MACRVNELHIAGAHRRRPLLGLSPPRFSDCVTNQIKSNVPIETPNTGCCFSQKFSTSNSVAKNMCWT